MSFGIQVLVDARQVENAKKSVTGLNSLLDDMAQRKDISLGGGALADAEALRRASNEITKLGSLARIGENKGGLLNIQQWKDVDRITKNIGGYLEGWTKQTAKMKADLTDVNARIADMNRAMAQHMAGKIRLSDSAIREIGNDLGHLEGERGRLEKEIGDRAKYDGRAGALGTIAQQHSEAISEFGIGSLNQMGKSIANKMTSAMAWTMGAAGVLSFGALLGRAMNAYKEQDIGGAALSNMGISPFHSGAYGYLYNERKGFTENLAQGTGSTAGALSMMGLARSRSIDLGTMGGFANSLYQSTGMRGGSAVDFAAGVIGTNHNTKQMVTILDNVAKLLKSQEQRQGALIGGAESKAMAGLLSLNFNKSPLLQSSALYDRANSAIAAGGQNPGEQLFWWKMAGGDKYKGGFDDLLSIQAEQRKGIFSKTIRDNLKQKLGGMGRGQQLATVQTMMGLNSDPRDKNSEGALFLDEVLMSSVDFNDEASLKKALGNSPNAQKIINAMAQSKTLANAQQREQLDARAGSKFTPAIQRWEENIIKRSEEVINYLEGRSNKGLPSIAGSFLSENWNSGVAGKFANIALGVGALSIVAKTVKTGNSIGKAVTGGGALLASRHPRQLPGGGFAGNVGKYMKWLGTRTGSGVASVATDLIFADEAGGGFHGDEEAKAARDYRGPVLGNGAPKGDAVSELQAANITLAMILTLLSGVINIGTTKAEGTAR